MRLAETPDALAVLCQKPFQSVLKFITLAGTAGGTIKKCVLDVPLSPGRGCAGTWSRDPFTGCDREDAHKHADIRRVASRCGVTSIGKPTEPVPPSAGAGVRDWASRSFVKPDSLTYVQLRLLLSAT